MQKNLLNAVMERSDGAQLRAGRLEWILRVSKTKCAETFMRFSTDKTLNLLAHTLLVPDLTLLYSTTEYRYCDNVIILFVPNWTTSTGSPTADSECI